MRRGRKTGAIQLMLELRKIEVQAAQDESLMLACKKAEISGQS